MSKNFSGFWRVTFNNRQPIDLRYNDYSVQWEHTSNKYIYYLVLEGYSEPTVFRKSLHSGELEIADRVTKISYIIDKQHTEGEH